MDDLIKIAPNGQWTLEKAFDPNKQSAREKTQAMIEEFMNRKKEFANPPPRDPYNGMKPPENIQPGQASTMNHKPTDPRNMPTEEERKIARMLADQQALLAEREKQKNVVSREVSMGNEPQGPTAPRGKVTVRAFDPNRKGPVVEKKPQLGGNSVELMPPMEYQEDPKTGQRSMQVRQGTYHNQAATTRGKIVDRTVGFRNEKTGEYGARKISQLERHHWQWDHDNKKWNHVGTIYESPSASDGGNAKLGLKPQLDAHAAMRGPKADSDD